MLSKKNQILIDVFIDFKLNLLPSAQNARLLHESNVLLLQKEVKIVKTYFAFSFTTKNLI